MGQSIAINAARDTTCVLSIFLVDGRTDETKEPGDLTRRMAYLERNIRSYTRVFFGWTILRWESRSSWEISEKRSLEDNSTLYPDLIRIDIKYKVRVTSS